MQLQPGTTLCGGKYRIERVLGQGGFGITYLAVQTGLNRLVAVKEFFMREHCNRDAQTCHVSVPSIGSRELVERFRQKFLKEAQTIAAFDQPNIVRIYDISEENGTAYYVMENIDGGALSDQTMPMNEEKALAYIRQIAAALKYIHSHNVLHLDVKPSNILLRRNGDAVLIDFGISKRYDEEGGQTSSTPAGLSKGYAPLEQYNQGLQTFSPATDVYSLGATLYKLVTGETPPEASIVNEEGLPDRPANVSTAVWNAITKAMQPRRKDRPQTIEAFMKLLDAPATSDEETHIVTDNNSEATQVVQPEPQKRQTPKPTPKPTAKPQQKPAAVKSSGGIKPQPTKSSNKKAILIGVGIAGAIGLIIVLGLVGWCTSNMLDDWDHIDSLANDSAAYEEIADSLEADSISDLLAIDQTTSTDKKAEEEARKKAEEEETKKKAEKEAKKKAEEEAKKKAEEEAMKKAEEEAKKKAEQSKTVDESQTSNDDNKVFDVVEVAASFPGGNSALINFLSSNVRYPAVAQENAIQGTVAVKFIIERDGSITNAQVVKSVDPSLDKEALRVVNSMPKWTPGKQNGKPLRTTFTVPITFRLQNK